MGQPKLAEANWTLRRREKERLSGKSRSSSWEPIWPQMLNILGDEQHPPVFINFFFAK